MPSCWICTNRSAPEFGNVPKNSNSMLRKTQSQPSNKECMIKLLSLQDGGSKSEKQKRSSSQTIVTKRRHVSPSSPTGGKEKTIGSGAGSPKPKKNIFDGFRNPLKSKSKSQEGSAAESCVIGGNLGVHDNVENVHSMPELSQNEGDLSPMASPAVSPSSCGTVRIVQDYRAQRDDEISVCKGESLMLLDSRMDSNNKHEYICVQRASNVGWVPVYVSERERSSEKGLEKEKSSERASERGSEKKPWHLKLRKPSFTKKDPLAFKPNIGNVDRITARKEKGHAKV